ncbi:Arm DNA-binding domain-containing protein [Phenylobacterium sp.]|jgi:hypothetical protein|uniref:Arm DNA-binding domain-containing protein n=1 Tax=Phenylobacterium sp. TaxID=1871053 RepID=UPI0039C96775
MEKRLARITKRAVDALTAREGRETYLWDSELRGFGVRLGASGAKTYIVQYCNEEGRTRKLALGRHGPLTPEQARKLASSSSAQSPRARTRQRCGAPSERASRWERCATGILRTPAAAGSSAGAGGPSRPGPSTWTKAASNGSGRTEGPLLAGQLMWASNPLQGDGQPPIRLRYASRLISRMHSD